MLQKAIFVIGNNSDNIYNGPRKSRKLKHLLNRTKLQKQVYGQRLLKIITQSQLTLLVGSFITEKSHRHHKVKVQNQG
jgi:hypothetical protein